MSSSRAPGWRRFAGPGHHPYPVGSTNGSVWNVALVFNGIDRLRGSGAPVTVNPPSVTRLFDGPYASLVGTALLAALVLGGLAVLVAVLAGRRDGPPPRPARAGAVAIATWLVGGAALFSAMQLLHPRYLEVITPAIAAAIGIGVVSLAAAAGRRRTAAAVLAGGATAAALGQLALGPGTPARATVVVVVIAAAGLVVVALSRGGAGPRRWPCSRSWPCSPSRPPTR